MNRNLLILHCLVGLLALGVAERVLCAEPADEGQNTPYTPLMIAAMEGDVEKAKALISDGADLNATACPIHYGASWGLAHFQTPLHAAAVSYMPGSVEIMRLILDAGTPLNDLSDKVLQAAALHHAAVHGRDALNHDPMASARKMAMLCEAGIPVDIRYSTQYDYDVTPLIYVVHEGRYQGRESQLNVLKELLSRRADVNAADMYGKTALHYAVENMDAEIAAILMKAGANADAEDGTGQTPRELAQHVYPRTDVLKALGLPATQPPAGDIRAHVHPSRREGVAPLAVFFDGIGSDGLANGDYVNASYTWDFDATGVDPQTPRRQAIGFNVAHVFRKPGEYTVKMRVTDTAANEGETTVTIKVLPFAGKTFYVSACGDDANPGTMDKPWKTAAFAFTQIKPNTRVLFRRGDTFAMPDAAALAIRDVNGPIVIGAYSDPAQPDSRAPLMTGRTGFTISEVSDLRILDLHLRGNSFVRRGPDAGPTGFSLNTCRNILAMNLEIERVGQNGFYTGSMERPCDGIYVVDCSLHDFGAVGLFGARPHRIAFIGNQIERIYSMEHGYRTQGAVKSYLAHNTIINAVSAKTSVQIRGNAAQTVVVGNVFDQHVSFCVKNKSSMEFIRDVLAEGNVSSSGYGGITAQNVTIRNNLFVRPDQLTPMKDPERPGREFVRGMPIFAKLGEHDFYAGVVESVRIERNSCYGDVMLVGGRGNGVSVEHNICCIAAPGLASSQARFFGVTRPDELKSDRNLYYAVNTTNAAPLDVTAFLAKRRSEGHDQHSTIEDPRFLSTDPMVPDFLKTDPAGPAVGKGAGPSVRADKLSRPGLAPSVLEFLKSFHAIRDTKDLQRE